MNGHEITAASAARALRDRYPGNDVTARHEPGGVRASVTGRDGGMYVSVGDKPGMLSAWLGIDAPGGPHGDGGEALATGQAA